MEFTKKIDVENVLFDSHMHILTLSNICLSAYLSFINTHKLEESLAVFSAHDYIFKDLTISGGGASGVLTVFEHNQLNSIKLLEDDLCGIFEPQAAKSVFNRQGIDLCGKHFEKLVIFPLIMDFEIADIELDSYYKRLPAHSVTKQAFDLLEAIKQYRIERPNGKLIIRPYMGLNPAHWTAKKIETMLKTYFTHWSPTAKDALFTWEKIPRLLFNENKPYNNAFAGIKLYPPLDFDPWSNDSEEREKNELLYDFCEKRGIPIITHCDDQGFRMLPLEKSFTYTSPDRWNSVLKKYPNLFLDIAHFGKQYYRGILFRKENNWQKKIMRLLLDFKNVYTDMSFNGVDKNAWDTMALSIKEFSPKHEHEIFSKILFGTDWPLSAIKSTSATQYWRNFMSSSLSDDLKLQLIHKNPRNFHFR